MEREEYLGESQLLRYGRAAAPVYFLLVLLDVHEAIALLSQVLRDILPLEVGLSRLAGRVLHEVQELSGDQVTYFILHCRDPAQKLGNFKV